MVAVQGGAVTSLNPSQRAFLRFHCRHTPAQWRWHFVGTQLRVRTEHGQGATIWKDDLGQLLALGLMRRGVGEIIEITESGRVAVRTWELEGAGT